jgi:prepilin-type N-terminal cleavage/methylation domain-containing protein
MEENGESTVEISRRKKMKNYLLRLILTVLNKSNLNRGLTLYETLAVVFIIGILTAIAIPTFLGIINQQRVTLAQDKVIESIRKTQRESESENSSYSASFSVMNAVPKVAVYQTDNSIQSMTNLPSSIVRSTPLKRIKWEELSTGANSHQLFIGTNDPTHTITFDSGITQNVNFMVIVALADKNGQPIPSSMRCVVVVNNEGAIKTGKSKECGIFQTQWGDVSTMQEDSSIPFPRITP